MVDLLLLWHNEAFLMTYVLILDSINTPECVLRVHDIDS